MKTITKVAAAAVLAAAAFVVFVPSWTPVPTGTEIGIPQEINFSDKINETAASNQAPTPLPAVETGGPSATQVYKNVQVLTDVSAAEFMRLQTAITAWIAPQQGCDYCHVGTDYASDAKATKITARLMLRMTRHVNTSWSNHVSAAGVTCYTCHRGQPVPADAWFPAAPVAQKPFIGKQDAWRESADTVRHFFPDAGFAEYFLQDQPIAVQSTTVEPSNTVHSFDETKRIYEMMMQMSDGIGANCGLCHNSRAFSDWSQSSPYRWNTYWAIRLVRDLNRNFLLPASVAMPQTRELIDPNRIPAFPARETGVQNGNGMVVCKTCHQGVTKPLRGVNMVNDYPGLGGPVTAKAIDAPPPSGG